MNLNELSPEVKSWIALRTSARWEKKIAETLQNRVVPVFLPTISRVTRYATKAQSSEIPLFPGYLFCSEQDFIGNPNVPASCRKQIAQILRPTDSLQLKTELQHVAEILRNHHLIQERRYGSPGESVRILSGPLRGVPGVIVALKPKKRMLVLKISFLGVRLDVEIEEDLVEKEG